MLLTRLPEVLRAAGLRVVEEPGWLTRGHGPMVAVDGTVVHHTAGPRSGIFPSRNVLVEGRPDLRGPLCHLGVDRDAVVHVIASGLAWHAGAVRATSYSNPRRIGIEVESSGAAADPWSPAVVDAVELTNAALALEWHFTAGDVLGHKEVCYPAGRKIDPHPVDMGELRDGVDRRIAILGRVSRDEPRQVPVSSSRPVLSYGNRGSSVTALQIRLRALGWVVDATGVFDAATRRAVLGVQVAAQLVVDGIVGPRTWAAVDRGQRPRFVVAGVVQRDDRGDDVVDVQRALTRCGIPTADDGDFGRVTEGNVRRLQALRDLDVDGRVGRDTAAGLGGKAA